MERMSADEEDLALRQVKRTHLKTYHEVMMS